LLNRNKIARVRASKIWKLTHRRDTRIGTYSVAMTRAQNVTSVAILHMLAAGPASMLDGSTNVGYSRCDEHIQVQARLLTK